VPARNWLPRKSRPGSPLWWHPTSPITRTNSLFLVTSLTVPLWGNRKGRGPDLSNTDPLGKYWREREFEYERMYEKEIVTAAVEHRGIRVIGVSRGFITVKQAIAMPGDLASLLEGQRMQIFGITWGSYLGGKFNALHSSRPNDAVTAFTEVGHYISVPLEHRSP
jgi:hypothetical protein